MKIFLTIGTQEPFDRLIKFVDEIAENFKENSISIQAQISYSDYMAKNIDTFDFITPNQFELKFNQADLIISHAGMGTIISASTMNKSIIVMPRLAKLGEHRNDHQLATAKAFKDLGYVHVAYSIEELNQLMDLAIAGKLPHLHKIGEYASSKLLSAIENFIS